MLVVSFDRLKMFAFFDILKYEVVKRMKKAFAILLCLLILLSGCSRRTLIEGYAQNCWHQIGPADAESMKYL